MASAKKAKVAPDDGRWFAAFQELVPGWAPRTLAGVRERWAFVKDAVESHASANGAETARGYHPESDDVVGLAEELPFTLWYSASKSVQACLEKIDREELRAVVPKTAPDDDPVQRALTLLAPLYEKTVKEEMLQWADTGLDEEEDGEEEE